MLTAPLSLSEGKKEKVEKSFCPGGPSKTNRNTETETETNKNTETSERNSENSENIEALPFRIGTLQKRIFKSV